MSKILSAGRTRCHIHKDEIDNAGLSVCWDWVLEMYPLCVHYMMMTTIYDDDDDDDEEEEEEVEDDNDDN